MPNEVDQFAGFIRGRGFKFTPQRKYVAETSLEFEGQFTTGQLYALVRKQRPRIGRSTVYRTLEHMVGSGVVAQLNARGGTAYYERVAGRLHHDQLLCLACGKVDGAALGELEESLFERSVQSKARELGWELKYYVLAGRGVCRACRLERGPGYKSRAGSGPAPRRAPEAFPEKAASST